MENGAGTARSWARRTGSTGFDIPDPTRGWRSARALRGGVTWRRPRIAASKNESELGPFPSPGAKSHFRSEEHTSELQSLMRTSYAVFCLKTKLLVPHQKPHQLDAHTGIALTYVTH